MTNHQRKRNSVAAFMIVAQHCCMTTTAWAPRQTSPLQHRQSFSATTTTSRLHVTPPSPFDDSFPLLDTLKEASAAQDSYIFDLIHPSQVLEETTNAAQASGVLTELSRVILDVLTLVAPTTMFLRLALVLGRVFGMEATYLKDHEIAMDQLLFDVPLLGLYAYLFSRSIYPILRSFFTKHTELDDLVFEQLFKPSGVSWIQYRSMLAADCIDWITASPGDVLIDERDNSGDHPEVDYLYWLSEGDYIVSYKDSVLYTINRTEGKSIDDPSAVGFNGDMRFLYNLDRKNRKEQQRKNKNTIVDEDQDYPMETTTIGERGATFMRLNSAILFELMDDDDQLAASIRGLLLKSLQRKVGNLLVSRQEEKETTEKIAATQTVRSTGSLAQRNHTETLHHAR